MSLALYNDQNNYISISKGDLKVGDVYCSTFGLREGCPYVYRVVSIEGDKLWVRSVDPKGIQEDMNDGPYQHGRYIYKFVDPRMVCQECGDLIPGVDYLCSECR